MFTGVNLVPVDTIVPVGDDFVFFLRPMAAPGGHAAASTFTTTDEFLQSLRFWLPAEVSCAWHSCPGPWVGYCD